MRSIFTVIGVLAVGLFTAAPHLALASDEAAADASTDASTPVPAPVSARLRVEIHGLRNAQGKVLCALFRSPEGFPRGGAAFQRASSRIQDGRAVCEFSELQDGTTYAVSFLHDENDNGRMDFNFFGLPKEGYGFSNDVHPHLSPPSFEAAAFRLRGRAQVLQLSAQY